MEHLSNWDDAKICIGSYPASGFNNGDAWPGVVAQIFWLKCVFLLVPSTLLFHLIVKLPTYLKMTWPNIVSDVLYRKTLIGVSADFVVVNGSPQFLLSSIKLSNVSLSEYVIF